MELKSRELWVCDLGQVPYPDALALQQRLRELRQREAVPDILLLLEHPPTYTRGRRSDPADLPFDKAWYNDRGIELFDTNRGGKITYHAPGQLVGYPIMRIDDVIAFIRKIEQAVIEALAQEGIKAEIRKGLTGIWVGQAKIGSIGIHVSRGVTMHGFAVNVDLDLEPFSWVVACGIEGVSMTSIERERGSGDIDRLRRRIDVTFANAFKLRHRVVSVSRLKAMCEANTDGKQPVASWL